MDYMEEHCLHVADKRGEEIYDELLRRGWRDNEGVPVRNWRRFLDGLEATIESATENR